MANRSIWRPYTQEKSASRSMPISCASGAHLYAKNGQKIFDGISSWWLITHGHCHPAIAESIARQAHQLDQVTFATFTHAPAEKLAELLIEITPSDLTKVFFSDNGSTAVEVALKMALQACAQTGRPEKSKFLAFESSYHGDTVGAMSVSGASAFNKPYKQTLFDVLKAKHPTVSTAPLAAWTADFDQLIDSHHAELAGVILEPLLQGAGGMIVWPIEAIRQIVKTCREFDIFVIFDEVMTGFGRTGSMFAMDQIGLGPDLACLSKGLTGGSLPLAATLATDKIFEAFQSPSRSKMLFHGHSFTGNPISCAAAVANIELFSREGTLEKVRDLCSHQKKFLSHLQRKALVSDARTCGTVAAFEIGEGSYLSEPQQIGARLFDQGIFLRPLGDTIYVMPPYCSSYEDLRSVWAALETFLTN